MVLLKKKPVKTIKITNISSILPKPRLLKLFDLVILQVTFQKAKKELQVRKCQPRQPTQVLTEP